MFIMSVVRTIAVYFYHSTSLLDQFLAACAQSQVITTLFLQLSGTFAFPVIYSIVTSI